MITASILLANGGARQIRAIAFRISDGDVAYGLGKLKEAQAIYSEVVGLADSEHTEFSKEDLRFLIAYADFRRVSVECELKNTGFPNWEDFAKAIENLPANGFLKRHFRF